MEAQYLPDALQNERFYEPSDEGEETEMSARQRARWGPSRANWPPLQKPPPVLPVFPVKADSRMIAR